MNLKVGDRVTRAEGVFIGDVGSVSRIEGKIVYVLWDGWQWEHPCYTKIENITNNLKNENLFDKTVYIDT